MRVGTFGRAATIHVRHDRRKSRRALPLETDAAVLRAAVEDAIPALRHLPRREDRQRTLELAVVVDVSARGAVTMMLETLAFVERLKSRIETIAIDVGVLCAIDQQ